MMLPPRTTNPKKKRTPDRNTQTPVTVPGETVYPDGQPQPLLTGTLVERLKRRRAAERKAKEAAA